jgi:glyoxylase-like metal-dependent hydrolase (beta-lactamase superfamily II)
VNPIVARFVRAVLAAASALLMLLCVGAAPPAAPSAAPPKRAGVDGFARVIRKLTDHVWLVERPVATDAPFEGNVEVIEQGDGLVVVDAGGAPPAGRHIARLIRTVSAKPVKAIVYTHYHGDHNLGAGELLKVWPHAVVISTVKTRENMLGKPMTYIRTYAQSYGDMVGYARQQAATDSLPASLRAGWGRFAAAGPSIVAGYTGLSTYPATITFQDALSLPDSVAPVEVRFLGRANTDGDAIVWLPRQRLLCTGDIVVHPIPYASACFLGEWIGVLEKLDAYDFAYLVPGHGEVQRDREYVDRVIAALAEIRAQVAPLAKEGKSLDEVRHAVKLDGLKDRFAGDDAWKRFLMSAVFLGDVVKNAWQEARGDSIVQGGS